MVSQPHVVADVHRRGLRGALRAIVDRVPVGVGDIGAIGQHHPVSEDDFIAGAEPRTGTHEHTVPDLYAALAFPTPPDPHFHPVTRLADGGETPPYTNIVAGDVHVPGFHHRMVRPEVVAFRAQKILGVPVPELEIALLDPERPQVLAHSVSFSWL